MGLVGGRVKPGQAKPGQQAENQRWGQRFNAGSVIQPAKGGELQ
ncbi:hypothetical protein ULF88_18310 [Halopseudomonas pachastrellae]|nr:hypothetical protein [Halopseudomonas pachastrellae]